MKGKRFTTTFKAAMIAALLLLGAANAVAAVAPLPASKSKKTGLTKQRTMNKSKQTNTFNTPDFAFPETVEKNARPQWENALAKRDGLKALQAALQLVVANNLISNDNFNSNIEMLDSAVRVMPPVYASLFRLLQADLYTGLYNLDRWNYNQRVLPLDSFPADVRTWSKDLFAKKVFELVMRATDNPAESRKVPLSDIKSVLTDYNVALNAGCSVNDFIVFKATSILGNFSGRSEDNIIPFEPTLSGNDANFPAKSGQLSLSLINTLINYRAEAGNEAALSLAIVRKSDMLSESEGSERMTFLKEWKDRLIDSPADARIIVKYYNAFKNEMPDDEKESKAIYSQMKQWVEKFPSAEGSDAVRYCLASMSLPKMNVSIPSQILPGKAVKCNVNIENAQKGYLLIYGISPETMRNGSFNVSKFPGNARFIKAVPVTVEGEIPFSKSIDVELGPLAAGYHVVVPSPSSSLPSNWKELVDRWSIQPINVSEITLFTNYDSAKEDSGKLYVVEAANQCPVKGAKVSIFGNNDKVIKSGVTADDGSFPLPQGYSRAMVSYKESNAESYTGYYVSKRESKPEVRCNILTDLSIYRPGDEVRFVLVEWLSEKSSNSILKDEPVKVVMRDANWNPVDTLSLRTDSDGRVNGSFEIPKTGLLGTYSLTAVSESRGSDMIGRVHFEVADYKTPGFIVDLKKDGAENYEAGDIVSFKGSVKTYSGMPLGDAKVEYKVTWQPWWRWGGDYSNASYGGIVNTDSEGNFKIELPTENLKGTRYEHGIFTIAADATSASGETQKAPDLRFSLGKDYSVRPSFPDRICVDSDSIKLNIPVYDILGLPVIKNVDYRIEEYSPTTGEGKLVREGKFISPLLDVPASDIPSGKYNIIVNLEGDTLKADKQLVVFRKDDVRPPYPTPLWVPEKTYIAPEGSKNVEVKFGSGYNDSWILAVVTDANGIVRREWIKLSDENSVISVPCPADGTNTRVTLSGMRDFNQTVSTITVEPSSAKKKLEVKASTFRDRLTSGAFEKWKFSFTECGKQIADIPAFAVMTDKALNAIAPFSWTFSPGRGFIYTNAPISTVGRGFARTSARFARNPKYVGFSSFVPTWNTYGYGLGMDRIGNIRLTSRSLSIKGGGAVLADNVVNEVHEEAEVFYSVADMAFEEPRMMNAAGVKSEGAMATKKMAAVTEEIAEDADGLEEMPVGNSAHAQEQLRPMEMPLAFFLPGLKGDKNGNVEVEFEVPNFNTTWQFQLFGYTPDLLTAGITLDAVASKTVMVQTNSPRFLRTGDVAEISALVFNNSDKTEKLDGEITIFNPITGETITSYHQGSEPVQPSGNRKVSIKFEVPSDIDAIGIKVIGSSGQFSDGEQTVIPILPSSTPVVESIQFYLGKDKENFASRLPNFKSDANVTLRYCTNPVWECVLALPSVITPDSKNVLTLMQALYANATASSIVARYPQVKEGLMSLFSKNGEEETLKSNLEKDASLKTVELNNTPWVNNAASETLRLNSLSKLIEGDNAAKAVESLLKDVKGLQNSDGGWSWCNGMKSSEFITRNVLARFAMMKQNGSLSADALAMAKKGISYCDRKIYANYVESKHHFSTTDMLDYLYIRSSFNAGTGPTGFSSLKEKALKAIASEWKDFSIRDKALAAMLMARSKGYERNAGIILESLKQYAVKDADKGWAFDNLSSGRNGWNRLSVTSLVLEAFAEIEPGAEAVDGLRQWLVLQKETEDWGANSNTVEVIQAILQSGSDWISDEVSPEIQIGGKMLRPVDKEKLTGIVTLSLDPKQVSGKELRIGRTTSIPAWGAVISQYISPIKDVRSEVCENLKIEKQLLVVNSTGEGEAIGKGELKVGDKVRVTLTVTCDKDMNYVAIIDDRPACLSPDVQLSGYTFTDGLGIYREVRDTKTSLFIDFLPKGANVITYDCHVDRTGTYANGIATVQSQYSPQQVAHSAGKYITVK